MEREDSILHRDRVYRGGRDRGERTDWRVERRIDGGMDWVNRPRVMDLDE